MHFTESTAKKVVLWSLLAVVSSAPLFPLSNFVGHPHWDLIRWIPFQDFSLSRNMLKDVIGNIIWFIMLGYLIHHRLAEGSPSPWTIATIIAISGCISLLAEFFQVFCHNRCPSMTDVTCNVLGAGLGGYLAQNQQAAAATKPWPAVWLSNLTTHRYFNWFPGLTRQGFPFD